MTYVSLVERIVWDQHVLQYKKICIIRNASHFKLTYKLSTK